MSSKFPFLSKMILSEAIVANPTSIDQYLLTFVNAVSHAEGKKWINTKVRKHLFKTEELLRQIDSQSVLTYVDTIPDYVKTALNLGNPVFALDTNSPQISEFNIKMGHIVDYLNSIGHASRITVAQYRDNHPNVKRETALKGRATALISKLEQTAFVDIEAQSNKWFQFVSSHRDLSHKVTGVERLIDWGSHYAVLYTSTEAIELSGDDLSNCLRYSYYSDDIQRGTMKVYGIVEKSKSGDATKDRAVVGISVQKKSDQWEPNECKGFGNRVPAVQYHKMIAELFTHIKTIGVSDDLRAMHISGSRMDGEYKYGTFEDVAEVVYNMNGIRILKTDKDVQFGSGRVGGSFKIGYRGTLSSFVGDVNHIGVNNMVKILNILSMPLDQYGARHFLQEFGIVSNSDLTYSLLTHDDNLVYELNGIKVYQTYSHLAILDPREDYPEYYTLTNKPGTGKKFLKIYNEPTISPDDFINICNRIDLLPNNQSDYMESNQIASLPSGVGYYADVLTKVEHNGIVSYFGLSYSEDFDDLRLVIPSSNYFIKVSLDNTIEATYYNATEVERVHLVYAFNELKFKLPSKRVVENDIEGHLGISLNQKTQRFQLMEDMGKVVFKTDSMETLKINDDYYIRNNNNQFVKMGVSGDKFLNNMWFDKNYTSPGFPEYVKHCRFIMDKLKVNRLANINHAFLFVNQVPILTCGDAVKYIRSKGKEAFVKGVGDRMVPAYLLHDPIVDQKALIGLLFNPENEQPFTITKSEVSMGENTVPEEKLVLDMLFYRILNGSIHRSIQTAINARASSILKKAKRYVKANKNTYFKIENSYTSSDVTASADLFTTLKDHNNKIRDNISSSLEKLSNNDEEGFYNAILMMTSMREY